jgi:hypothetical protein
MSVKKEFKKETNEPVVTQDEVSFQVLTPEEFRNLKIRKRGNGKYDKAIQAALGGQIVKVDCGTAPAAGGLAYKIKTKPEYQGKISASRVQGRWVVIYPVS